MFPRNSKCEVDTLVRRELWTINSNKQRHKKKLDQTRKSRLGDELIARTENGSLSNLRLQELELLLSQEGRR